MEEARKPPVTREAALRIALAARALPKVTLPALIEQLQRRLGEAIDEENLRQVTVTMLKTGFASADGEEDGEDIGIGLEAMKLAVRILWGETQGDETLPKIATYEEGEMPGSVRVAIASDKGDTLSGHFGSCLRFLVYQVSPSEIRLVDIRDTMDAEFAEDKNLWRAKLIGDCHVCYVVSIGGPALDILKPFQTAMVESPPPWMLKALGVAAEKRLKNYNAAEIDE